MTTPSKTEPVEVQFPRFHDLPATVRREVYGQLLPTSSGHRFWLKQSAYWTSSRPGRRLLGSAANYMFRSRRELQYTGLAELGILPRSSASENEDGHKTLMALRLVSKDIAAEVEAIFFGREGAELCLELDSVFVPFLKKCVGCLAGLRSQNNMNPGLLKWLSRFRRMVVFLQEDLIPELELLRVIFEDESFYAEQKMSPPQLLPRESQLGRNRDLTLVIFPFNEVVADTYDKQQMPVWEIIDGNGDLPPALLQKEKKTQESNPSSNSEQAAQIPRFTSVNKIETPELWVQKRPPIIGVGDTANRNDRMFYKISFTAQFNIPASEPDSLTSSGETRRHRFPVRGCYVNWTAPGVMKDLLGWEPEVIEDDSDWIYEQRGVFMIKTGRTPAMATLPTNSEDQPE